MTDYRAMYHALGHKLLALAKANGELKQKVAEAELRVVRREYAISELLAAVQDISSLLPAHAQWRLAEAKDRARHYLYFYDDRLIREKLEHDTGKVITLV